MGSFASTATGAITFAPALTATEIRRVSGWGPNLSDSHGPTIILAPSSVVDDHELVLAIDETVEFYDEAEIFRRSASRIVIGRGDESWNRRHVADQLRQFVDAWGEGRTFTGRIEVHSAEGDRWATRYEVVDGEVVVTQATVDDSGNLSWPDETPVDTITVTQGPDNDEGNDTFVVVWNDYPIGSIEVEPDAKHYRALGLDGLPVATSSTTLGAVGILIREFVRSEGEA